MSMGLGLVWADAGSLSRLARSLDDELGVAGCGEGVGDGDEWSKSEGEWEAKEGSVEDAR